MKYDQTILSILSEWTDEFNATLLNNNSLCIALFSTDRKLVFANHSIAVLFKGDPCDSFINPTFENLIRLENSKPLIFSGFITLGDYSMVNISIWAQVYRKGNNLLVVGGVDALQLTEQNKIMHKLNSEISNLQRELIREKNTLEITLKKLNQANNELRDINLSKDRFISILAHDLKGPFMSILGFLRLLLKNIRNYSIDKIESQLSIVNNSSKSTFKLLEDILLWIKANSGKVPYDPQKLYLKNICNDVIENLQLTADTKEISINQFVAAEQLVFADNDMVNTILRNLVSNAIKFTPKNGEINIYAESNQSHVIISVSDNGIGISPNTMIRLFDISQKITTKGTENEKGTGLGLLLCKDFIEMHDGIIWAESEVGKGSKFKFTLPLYHDK